MLAIKKLVFVGFSLFTLSASFNTAHAALFDDKEARKKIVELELKQQANHDATLAAIADLKKRVVAIEAIVQGGGLADMQNQIEALKQDVANLKGDLEVAQHNLDATQTRQKDLYTDTDTRLRRIESSPVPTPANAAPANPAAPSAVPAAAPSAVQADAKSVAEEKEVKALADANLLSQSAKHKEAFVAFDNFLKEYPTSKLAPEALYGMGYSQFALKSYKSAIATQQKVIDLHPESSKVPEAMFNMANSQIQLGQVNNAKKTLRSLIEKHPNAAVTPSAQRRLKALEAIR